MGQAAVPKGGKEGKEKMWVSPGRRIPIIACFMGAWAYIDKLARASGYGTIFIVYQMDTGIRLGNCRKAGAMKKLWLGIGMVCVLLTLGLVSCDAEDKGGLGTRIRIRNREWRSQMVVERDGRLYGSPELLSIGERWSIVRRGEAVYASIPVMDGKTETVRLAVDEHGLTDLTFFSARAGLGYEWNERKREINLFKEDGEEAHPSLLQGQGKVVLVWDPTSSFDPARPFWPAEGRDRMIAPDWGSYETIGEGEKIYSVLYVEQARADGVAVTPMISNGFNAEATAAFLRDGKARSRFLRRLAAYTDMYGVDGWNLDFENMDPDDAARFTDWVRDVAKVLHDMGRTLSIDIMPMGSPRSYWTGCYDRKALAEHVDYEVLMAYDQIGRSSTYAGPNCAYDWVERILPPILEEVPPEQLILGLPFYTRVWSGDDGSAKQEVLTVAGTEDFVNRHKVVPRWQDKEKQWYADWRENGVRRRVWLEEERSLAEKVRLVEAHGLAGAAFWRYGFEPGALYEALDTAL